MANVADRRRTPAALALAALALAACAGPEPAPPEPSPVHPMIVIGIDGAEWSVIEALWERGELPAMKALAARGTRATLETDYGKSPVIWTTIATGRRPRVHGITDFVIPTEEGDVPVSSDLRRVPALWNMVSATGRRAAVLGWWASWPAEPIEGGVVVSDRSLLEKERRAYPAEIEAEIDRLVADPDDGGWDRSEIAQRRDRLAAHFGRELASRDVDGRGFDLMLVYFRAVDIESHNHWRYWEPERFGPPDPDLSADELAERAERIPRVYRVTDRAIGEIVAAAPAETNVLVVSDHGFRPAKEERIQLLFDLDPLLERLGFVVRTADGGVDLEASSVYGYRSPPHRREKLLRFGGAVPPRERESLRARLERELARITWAGGEPAFRVRDAKFRERRDGADFVVVVRRYGASPELWRDGLAFDQWPEAEAGRRLGNPVRLLSRISGIHRRGTDGIFIAAGADVAPHADVDGISIHDLAPTILYGIGLPTAEDFVGRVFTELYAAEFRRDHPMLTIESWGTREPGEEARSEADQELIEELGALGYLP